MRRLVLLLLITSACASTDWSFDAQQREQEAQRQEMMRQQAARVQQEDAYLRQQYPRSTRGLGESSIRLAPGMSQLVVQDVVGQADYSASVTCGASLGPQRDWTCLEWAYRANDSGAQLMLLFQEMRPGQWHLVKWFWL